MTQFIEIMHPKPRFVDGTEVTAPRPTNDEAQALFARIVEDTPGLHAWSCNTLKMERTHLVIGAVTWSGYDLRALDELASVAADLEQSGFRIDIFDVDRVFQENESYDERIPGLGEFCQTPIVGVWEGGQQTRTESGFKARQLLTAYVNRHTETDAPPVV